MPPSIAPSPALAAAEPATVPPAADVYKSGKPAPEDKVPFGTKLAFSSGSFAGDWSGASNNLVNPVFVVLFGLSPSWVSFAQVIYRFYDAFVDLAVGVISDNARTRWGRRRPFIFAGAVLTGLWMPVLWLFDPSWGAQTLLFWMIGCFLVFYLFQTLFNIPWQSLLLEMTPDTNERTNVAALKGYLAKAAAILSGWIWFMTQLPMFRHAGGSGFFFRDGIGRELAGLPIFHGDHAQPCWMAVPDLLGISLTPIFPVVTTTPNALHGSLWVISVMGLLVILTGVMPALFVPERFYKAASHQAKVSMTQNVKLTFSNRPFVVLAIFSLLFLVGTYAKSSLSFFTSLYYVCNGDQQLAAKLAGLGGTLGLFTGLAGIPLFQWLANHYGKHRALAIAMWVTLSASFSTYFCYSPHHPYFSVISGVLLAPAGTGMWILIPSMTGDVADYDELRTGERREGAFAAVYSWVFKLSVSIAAGMAGPLVDLAGYHAGVAIQPESVLNWMRALLIVVPAVFIGAAIFTLRFYTLDRSRIAEVRGELEARRGKL